jgi:hypothetical protein
MITPGSANRRCHAIATELADITAWLPITIGHLHRLHDTTDGYPTGSSEISVTTSRGESTVERAVTQRRTSSEELDDIDSELQALEDIVAVLTNRNRRYRHDTRPDHVITDEERARLRCTGGGSIEPWTDPGCTEYAAPGRDGLCIKHWMRRYRWRRDTQLRSVTTR